MRPLSHAFLCLACALSGATPGHAASPAVKAEAVAETPKKKKGAAPKFIPSASQENTKERERRLLRECKGRPNAGACAGYAS